MIEDAQVLSRYRALYGIGEEATIERVRTHLALARDLRRRLLESTVDTRWRVFEECYDELYRDLPWLAGTGGSVDGPRWAKLIGPAPRSVYEIGSGDGKLARWLSERGYQVEATDVSRFRGNRRESDNLSWTVTDGVHLARFATQAPYDAVISDQLVEHLHPDDLADHLAGVKAILKPTGRYAFRTPHRLTGPHDASQIFDYPDPVGMHLREYTTRELHAALRAAGFGHVRAVFHPPASVPRFEGAAAPSRVYLGYLHAVESLLSLLPDARQKKAAKRLPSLFRPRVFLVASI